MESLGMEGRYQRVGMAVLSCAGGFAVLTKSLRTYSISSRLYPAEKFQKGPTAVNDEPSLEKYWRTRVKANQVARAARVAWTFCAAAAGRNRC